MKFSVDLSPSSPWGRNSFYQIFGLIFLIGTLFLTELRAQTTVVIDAGAAGTPSHNAGPVYRSSSTSTFHFSRYTYLYTASDLAAAGIGVGAQISELGWVKLNADSANGPAVFTIYMKNTSTAAFSNATETWANLTTGATVVYQNNSFLIPKTASPNYITFALSAPFVYTGGSIEISAECDLNGVPSPASTGVFNWLWSTVPQRIYGISQATSASAGTLSSTSNATTDLFDRRPFLQVTYTNGPCVSPPVAGTAVAEPNTPVCPGSTVTVALNGVAIGTGETYQWESAPSVSGPFTSLGSPVTTPAVLVNPTSTTFYRAVVTCGVSSATSTVVGVDVSTGLAAGTYTVNPALPTGGTNYQSFADVGNALKCGITGPVVFNVTNAVYDGQLVIGAISGTSAVNTVTFNGNGATISAVPTSTEKYVVLLNGAKYVVIDNFNIIGRDATYGIGIHLMNQADFNTIKNCTIDLSAVTSTTSTNSGGIIASGSITSTTSAGNNANNCIIKDNVIKGGVSGGMYYGISMIGNTSGLDCIGNEISNNVIQDFYATGIYLTNTDGTVIRKNNINRAKRELVTTFAGIQLNTGNRNAMIDANRIHNSHGGAITTSGTTYGIYFTVCDAPVSSENIVKNNLIYNLNTVTGTLYGLYNSGSDGMHAYFNTISLDFQGGTSGTIRAVYQTTTATNLVISNNIISLTQSGSGTKHVLYYGTTTSAITSNNNVIYLNSASGTNYIGFYSANQTSWVDWQAANTNAYDQNSVNTDPAFVNIAQGNLYPTSFAVNNVGSPVTGVTTDYAGTTRNITNPDPGAFEFTPSNDDAGVVSIDGLNGLFCPGSIPINVTLKNYGMSTLTSATINWSINGVVQSPVAYTGTLSSLTTTSVVLGNLNAIDGVGYDIVAWTTMPNGQPDLNAYNDSTMHEQYFTAMSGTYVVGVAGNFASMKQAVSSLISRGMCGAVVFNVNTAVYDGNLIIPQINGSSAVNTVTFNGNGATISADGTSADRAVIRLEGADYITFDNFNIVNLNATYGWGIHLTNASDNVTIKNNIIDVTACSSTTSTNSIGIAVSGSTTSGVTAGDNGMYCKILGNTIKGGLTGGLYYGITVLGASSVAQALGVEIVNNIIMDAYNANIYLTNVDGALVRGNDISRPNKQSVSTFAGVQLNGGCQNVKIEQNKIHNSHDNATSLTGSIYGIYFTSCDAPLGMENIASNNLIYNLNGSGGTIYGVYNSGSDGTHLYFNTISIDHTAAASGTVRGFYQITSATNVNFMNNNVSITYGGSGIKHGIYLATSTSVVNSNYNNIYVNSLGSGAQYVGYAVTSFATLTDWQAASLNIYDQNSTGVDPLFENISANDYRPTSAGMNNQGSPIVGITTDFAGVTRNATNPDAGALEFTPVLEDAGISEILGINAPCPGTVNLTATITNFGVLTINSATINWTINGTPQTPVSFVGVLGSGNSSPVSLGSLNMANAVLYEILAWTVNPNNNPDGKNDNDSTRLMAKTAMNGVYTVGPTGDYIDVASAADDLTFRGVCGPVVINVTPGVYNGHVALDRVEGTSSINTITFNGNGSTVSFGPDATNFGIVNLVATSYTTIDSFNIVGTSATHGVGVLLTDGSNYNTITNNIIDLTAVTSTSSTSSGISFTGSLVSAAATGSNGGDCVIENNTIIGGLTGGPYYGIVLAGNTGMVGCRRNVVRNNTIMDTYLYNIYLVNTDSTWVEGNDISRANKTSVSSFYGLYMGTANMNALLENNRIHDVHNSATTSTSVIYPIYCSSSDAPVGSPVYFINNMIYNIRGNGITYGIYNTGSNGMYYFYNTVSLDNQGTSSNTVRGFYQTTAATDVRFENNLISLTHAGTGSKHGIYFGTTTSSITSNRNAIYVNSTGSGSQNFGYYSSDQANLAAWQTVNASAYDQNSVEANPEFVNSAADDYTPNSFYVNKVAGPIAGITTDIFGNVRNLSLPDPGAIEFTPVPTNDGCNQAIVITAGSYLGSTVNSSTDVAPNCVVADAVSGGVWYSYTASGDYVTFSLCGSGFDSRIRVFEGSCAALSCVTGNEDFCATQSEVSFCSADLVTYYILVHGNGSAEGEFTLTVTETPVQQAVITSTSTDFCPGDSILLSAASAAGYAWNDVAMSISQDIYISVPGAYYTVITDANGCTDTSNVLNMAHHVVVAPVVSIQGDSSICNGDSVELISSLGLSYSWNNTTMDTTQSIWVNNNTLYSVVVEDTNGCLTSSVGIQVNILPLPVVDLGINREVCSRDAITLDAGNSGSQFAWSTGGNTQTISFQEPVGTYNVSVIVTDGNGCEGTDEVEIRVNDCTGIEEFLDNAGINIYPNPGKGEFQITTTGFEADQLFVMVTDYQGRSVHSGQLNNLIGSNQVIDLSTLTAGVYMVRVSSADRSAMTRLVIR